MTTSGNKRQKRNVVYCQLQNHSLLVKQILFTAERAEVVAGSSLPLGNTQDGFLPNQLRERNHEQCSTIS
jgi:hypothetical protein